MINTFSAFFMRRRNWTIPYVLFLAIFVVIPLFLIVYYAFTNDEGMFTFANFRKFMIHPDKHLRVFSRDRFDNDHSLSAAGISGRLDIEPSPI